MKPSGNLYKDIVLLANQLEAKLVQFQGLVLTFIFYQYDNNGDNSIEVKEMVPLVMDYLAITTDKEINAAEAEDLAKKLVVLCDQDNDGVVSLQELTAKWDSAVESMQK